MSLPPENETVSFTAARRKDPDAGDLDSLNAIHKRCVEAMNLQSWEITAIENAVHDIWGLIQDYFDQFNPHGVGKGRRKEYERSPDEAG